MSLYTDKAKETVAQVLKDTRNRPDIEIQKELTAAFPFHRNNLAAWKVYAAEIKKQSGRVMYG